MMNKSRLPSVINLLTVVFFLLLPYYFFSGKLFIGGDDTRLLYVYPLEFLNNISFFSWYNFSSVGSYNPNHFSSPFVAVWSVLSSIIRSKQTIDYLSFSLPLIIGFLYFQKFIKTFIPAKNDEYWLEIFIGSIVYILSPILILNQLSVFLYAAWLIALLPVLSYYFIRYLQTGSITYIFKNAMWCIWLSFALYSIPWVLGYVIPLMGGFIFTFSIYPKKKVIVFVKRGVIFTGILLLSQAFWLIPFSATFLGSGSNSYGGRVLSKEVANSFSNTVLATATGTIIYPFLNLFHRQIAVDYNWPLKKVFLDFYDNILLLNTIYIVILFIGIINIKKYLSENEKKYYATAFISFLISLYLFTVNIGFLKNFFLQLGILPGFAMFRNFYDKFALGYVILFAFLTTLSLIIIARVYKRKKYIFLFPLTVVILLNFMPSKQVVVRPLWMTKDIYTNINIPHEYTEFMRQISKGVPSSTNILSLPFNIASYSIIKDINSENVFAGTSPVKIFSGINDYSGSLSFPTYEANNIESYIKARDYRNLNNLFEKYNINYVLVTNNIPQQVKNSYLFNKDVLSRQDKLFLQNITDKEILKSRFGNYELYHTRSRQNILQSPNITYERVNPTQYKIYIKQIKPAQKLLFKESFHKGWELYLLKHPTGSWCKAHYRYAEDHSECKQQFALMTNNELSLLFSSPIYSSSHKSLNNANQWVIDPETIKKSYAQSYYERNKDGSINIEMILYFKPQMYFYIGFLISITTLFICVFSILRFRYKNSTNT